MNPMLASDWLEKKARFPVIAQPKIDGVRALHTTDRLTGRSMEPHANKHVSSYFSAPAFAGLDGEMAAASETDPALCRKTTSALNTIEGEPWIMWHVFDLLCQDTCHLRYVDRYKLLNKLIGELQELYPDSYGLHLTVVPGHIVDNIVQLEEVKAMWLAEGYEGVIVRDPEGLHKQGRSTPTEGGLLRIKDFTDDEMVVTDIEEGQSNQNIATIGANGYTERSTHKANMVPNGMIGALYGTDVKTGATMIKVAAGRMTHAERLAWFKDPSQIIGKMIKYKHFKVGVKDKIRFGTFQSIRAPSDI